MINRGVLNIYRPNKNPDKNLYGDNLDKFSGAESGVARNFKPGEFEKKEEYIFSIGQLLQSAKELRKRLKKKATDEGPLASKKLLDKSKVSLNKDGRPYSSSDEKKCQIMNPVHENKMCGSKRIVGTDSDSLLFGNSNYK
ncbi:hypothetical protein X798_04044, partial [Onchocerca flexuosa]